MSKRRGNQEGTIYQRTNGKWRAQISIQGKRLSHTAETRKEAQKWVREIKNGMERGLTHEGATITFGEWLDEWLVSKEHHVTIQTHSYYSQIVRDYIKPVLGRIRLRELNARQIQRFYNQKVSEGVGLRTVQKSHTIIHASLNSARKFGMIPYNPDDATNPPKPKPKPMKFLNQEQIKILLKVSQETNDRYYPLYYLALVTGMREGELLALKWEDIDLEKGILNVKFNLKRIPGGGLQIGKPKTESSIRTIKLGKSTIEVLRSQKKKLEEEKEKEYWQDEGFVFPSSIGTAVDPSNLIKQFRKLLKEAGLPRIRFHDLRHTAASLMLNNGVDVLVASQRLGHAQPSITLDVYGHLMPSMQNEVASLLDKIISINLV
jgi:integrase